MAIKISRREIIKDAIAGSIVVVFITMGLFSKPNINWLPVLFFGFCLTLLLLKYLLPENKIFNPGGNKSDEEKRADFLNSTGIFTHDENGFSISHKDFEQYISWDDITKITAWKEDLIAHDQIHLAFEANGSSITIHEDTPGWFRFNEKMETKLALKENWLPEVMFPAFERNETIIYSKGSSAIS